MQTALDRCEDRGRTEIHKVQQEARAAAYVRVSTEGQVWEDRFGIDAQGEAIRSYSEANGVEIVRWY